MTRNEILTCKEMIEPQLESLGWSWQDQLRIGPEWSISHNTRDRTDGELLTLTSVRCVDVGILRKSFAGE